MSIKNGLKFLATMWAAVAATFIVGWGAVQLGIMLAGVVGGMASLGIIISVFLFLVGTLL